MKTTLAIASLAAVAGLLGVVALQTGCETQSAQGNTLQIEPQTIGLYINQQHSFTATGGFTYQWSLSDTTLGFLDRSDGPTVIYYDRFDPGSNTTVVVQHLKVTSNLGGTHTQTDTTTGTNTTTTLTSGFTDTAEAVIEHLSAGTGPGTPKAAGLTITPAAVTLTSSNTVQQFVASGGTTTDYAWSMSDSGFGTLSPTTGSTATYTYTATSLSGQVVLTVTSSSGSPGTATITLTP